MNTKKKILFFHHCSDIGGAGLSGLNVLNSIDKSKFDVIVFSNSENNQMVTLFRNNGYRVIHGWKSPVIFSHFSGAEKFIFSPKFLLNMINILIDYNKINLVIKKVDPDIVIVNSITLFWIGSIAKKYKKKAICFVRETSTKGLLGIRTNIVEKSLDINFDKVVFISKYDAQRCRIQLSKKVVVCNVLKKDAFHDFDEIKNDTLQTNKKGHIKVLFLGGMSYLKGSHIIIKALYLTKQTNIKLVFLGYKWYGKKKLSNCKTIIQKIKYLLNLDFEKKVIEMIYNYNLLSKIEFHGNQFNVLKFYATCDVVVLPITSPHQLRPIFEAGLAKVAVILPDYCNYAELINSEACFWFARNNPFDLARVLVNICANPSTLKQRVNNNYLSTMKNHNELDYINKIRILLLEVSNDINKF